MKVEIGAGVGAGCVRECMYGWDVVSATGASAERKQVTRRRAFRYRLGRWQCNSTAHFSLSRSYRLLPCAADVCISNRARNSASLYTMRLSPGPRRDHAWRCAVTQVWSE
eukprot:6207848-Pleurochrysis_carterae.AAC.3